MIPKQPKVIRVAREPATLLPMLCWFIEAQDMPINTLHSYNLITNKPYPFSIKALKISTFK